MSNHARFNPSLERSSVTPPNDTPAAVPRKTARMKPQSESLKRRLHITHPAAPRAARRYLEESARMDRDRDRAPERERRFKVQLDSDDAGAGPLDRDDAPYHGRSSGRSRVASVSASREPGISTRRSSAETARAARNCSLDPPTPAQPRHSGQDERVGAQTSSDERLVPSARVRKRVKSAEFIEDSEGYSSWEEQPVKKRLRDVESGRDGRFSKSRPERAWPTFRSPSPSPPRRRLPPVPPLPRMSPDPELPTPLELTRGGYSTLGETQALLDDEAIESGDEGGEAPSAASDAGRQAWRGEDDYDYDDPFINDGELTSDQEDDLEADDLQSPTVKHSRLGPAFKERSDKLKSYCLYSSDDDDENAQDGRRRRLRKGSHRREAAVVPDSSLPFSSSTDKGKGKAVSVPNTVSSDEGALSDRAADELADMTEQEKAEFKLAVAESMRAQRPTVVGESSSQGSQLSTPRAQAMFGSPSPSLSTPMARAMFGTPSTGGTPSTSNPLQAATVQQETPMTMEELVRMSLPDVGPPAPEAPAPPPDTTAGGDGIKLVMLCTESDIPAVCGVSHPSYQDPLLRRYYEGLVNLLPGHIEPWGNMAGPGFVMFQAWGEQCPRMNARLALAAINFKESGPYRNPSRCSPCDVGLYNVPGIADRYHFYCAGESPSRMIGVSCGMVDKTQLGEPPDGGYRQRWIQLILHNQEWQRFKGFVRMVSGHDHLYCQYNKHAIQFSTRAINSPDSSDKNGKGSWKKKKMSDGGGLRVAQSKMFGSGGASEGAPNKMVMDGFSLPGEERVPVYDARTVTTFDIDTDLPRLAEVLPPWTEGEIPGGSFVIVGYTLATYRARNGNWTLGCNIHWAIVLGCSKEG